MYTSLSTAETIILNVTSHILIKTNGGHIRYTVSFRLCQYNSYIIIINIVVFINISISLKYSDQVNLTINGQILQTFMFVDGKVNLISKMLRSKDITLYM